MEKRTRKGKANESGRGRTREMFVMIFFSLLDWLIETREDLHGLSINKIKASSCLSMHSLC